MNVTGQPYTDADEELVAREIAEGRRPASFTGAVIHPTHAEQDAYDAGYAQGCEAVAVAIQERCAGSHLDLGDGPPDDCEHQRYAALARALGQADHG